MEPDYHRYELDLRLYLTLHAAQVEEAGAESDTDVAGGLTS